MHGDTKFALVSRCNFRGQYRENDKDRNRPDCRPDDPLTQKQPAQSRCNPFRRDPPIAETLGMDGRAAAGKRMHRSDTDGALACRHFPIPLDVGKRQSRFSFKTGYGSSDDLVIDEAIGPDFTFLHRRHYGVVRCLPMLSRVSVRGIVATSDLAAGAADTQMHPVLSRLDAFRADRARLVALRRSRIHHHVFMGASHRKPSGKYGLSRCAICCDIGRDGS